MLTLKFNQATCYARMSSRIDINWNENTNDETGVLQAAKFYEKAAGIYDDMLKTVLGLQNLENQGAWREFN